MQTIIITTHTGIVVVNVDWSVDLVLRVLTTVVTVFTKCVPARVISFCTHSGLSRTCAAPHNSSSGGGAPLLL